MKPRPRAYCSEESTSETLIFCHMRDGRSDGAVLSLAKRVNSIWSACTGASEDEVEILIALYPAKYVVRGVNDCMKPLACEGSAACSD